MIDWIKQLDDTILTWIQENLRTPVLDAIMTTITRLGDWGLIWVILAIVLLCRKKYRRYGGLLLLALACNFILGELILKNLIGRLRPFIEKPGMILLVQQPQGFSFPSSHASSSFAAAFILTKVNKKLAFFPHALAFLISFSRIYLYVHHPSDVIAGALLGLFMAWLLYLPFTRLFTREKKVPIKDGIHKEKN